MKEKRTLFELNQWISNALNTAIPGKIWVVAEISEQKENRRGHCYLELVEKRGDEIIARARATIWSYTYRMLKPYFETTTGQPFAPGLKILVQVSVDYHPVYGLSLNVKDIDPAFTMGELALKRKEIIDQLKREGVFEMNKGLALPLVPQKIAVISSKTAAGYQDFMEQLEKNAAGIRFYPHLFQAYMQGNDAASSIIQALDRIFRYEDFFDAVAIIRGGGAAADLSSFDNYELAYHVTQFPLPVITGIGHEKDDTIIDMVAHTRLKTPTAVAEFFVNGAGTFYERLMNLKEEVVSRARQNVDLKQQKLGRLTVGFHRSVSSFIHEKRNRLSTKGNKLQQAVTHFSYNKKHALYNIQYNLRTAISAFNQGQQRDIDRKQQDLRTAAKATIDEAFNENSRKTERLKSEVRRLLAKENERLRLNESTVRLLNPQNVLKRGYTLSLKKGRIVKSVEQVSEKDELETRFSDGKIKSIIIKKVSHGNERGNV